MWKIAITPDLNLVDDLFSRSINQLHLPKTKKRRI